MDKSRYLKTQIKGGDVLRAGILSCKGTFTLISDSGSYLHFAFRRPVGDDIWTNTDRVFVYSPTTHGCVYVGEFTNCQFRFTKKSEITKYSAEYRAIKYIEKLINNEISNPKLKIYSDIKGKNGESDDFYAEEVFNNRGVINDD